MFDPERDEDPGSRPFLVRLLVVATITIVGCVALWPSVHGFAAGPDHGTGCLAITDGWHADKGPPSRAELDAAFAAMPPQPTPEQRNDPVFMGQWRLAWRAAQASPAVLRANAQIDWIGGPGACVRPSRHRLIVSAIGLGIVAVVFAGIAVITRRTRKNLRPAPAVAGVS